MSVNASLRTNQQCKGENQRNKIMFMLHHAHVEIIGEHEEN